LQIFDRHANGEPVRNRAGAAPDAVEQVLSVIVSADGKNVYVAASLTDC
jgi:hypothetical protein